MSSVSYLSFVYLCTHASDGESGLQKEKKAGHVRQGITAVNVVVWFCFFGWLHSNSCCMSHLFSIESQTAQTAQSNCQQWQLTAFYIEAAYSLNAKVDMSSTMKAVLAYYSFDNMNENDCFTSIMSFHLLFKYEGQAVSVASLNRQQLPASQRNPFTLVEKVEKAWSVTALSRNFVVGTCWTLPELEKDRGFSVTRAFSKNRKCRLFFVIRKNWVKNGFNKELTAYSLILPIVIKCIVWL